jgi:hypothetical protein
MGREVAVAAELRRKVLPHAIIRGKNHRRHEVDFGSSPVRVEVHSSEETIEIFIEADYETLPEGRRRFALVNVPRHLFSMATGQAARRAAKSQ